MFIVLFLFDTGRGTKVDTLHVKLNSSRTLNIYFYSRIVLWEVIILPLLLKCNYWSYSLASMFNQLQITSLLVRNIQAKETTIEPYIIHFSLNQVTEKQKYFILYY